MMLEHRANLLEVVGAHIFDPEDAVRIADIDGGGRMKNGAPERAYLELDGARAPSQRLAWSRSDGAGAFMSSGTASPARRSRA